MANEPDRRSTRLRTANPSKYTIIQKIAAGGMAEIYVAKASGLAGSDRLCVLKKILPVAADNPKAVQMFLDEARIASTLQHENIVQMYEVGSMNKNYFIAMEYLHGEDVRMVLKTLYDSDQRLPLEHALHMVIGLCSGLHYAHEKKDINGKPLNIVHRDISPHNLFVTYDGGVKVLDFGIALASNRSHHTRIDVLKGKVSYMSPEQCHRLDLDRRSDIYATGIVLYELTTGLKLNPGDDDFEIMKRTCDGPVPRPSDDVDDYPEQLEEIVVKALAKHPEDRFQTAAEMQEALEDFAHDQRLRRSSLRLSGYIKKLFAERYESWQHGMDKGTDIQEMILARSTVSGSELEIEALGSGNSLEVVFDQLPTAAIAESKAARTIDPGSSETVAPPRLGAFAVFMAILALGAVGVAAYFLLTSSDGPQTYPGEPVTPTPAPVATIDPDAAPPHPDATVGPGTLDIETKPSRATVFIDGIKHDKRTPTVIDNIDSGEHELVLRRKGYADRTETVTVEAGAKLALKVTLERPSAKKKPKTPRKPGTDLDGETDEGDGPDQPMVGTLKVTTTPTCDVYVDGTPQGRTALRLQLPTGKHKVRLVNTELEVDVTKTITVYAGTVVTKHYTFARQ